MNAPCPTCQAPLLVSRLYQDGQRVRCADCRTPIIIRRTENTVTLERPEAE